jgi:LysM repeat protein
MSKILTKFSVLAISALLTLIWFSCASDTQNTNLTSEGLSYSENQSTFVSPKNPEKKSPDLCLIQGNSVKPASPPITITPQVLGVLIEGANFNEQEARKEIIEYIAQPGDNLSSIAVHFKILSDTIFWANNLKTTRIQIGQKLIILPVSGVIHYVEKNETLSEIVEIYKANLNKTITFNGLMNAHDIFPRDILIIPDGIMPTKKIYAPTLVPLASSLFICPISAPCRVTQWLHPRNAIDFSHKGMSCGEPIFAVMEGTVQRTGYGSLGGNFVQISHPNGVVTSYGHLQDIFVKPGQPVRQGTPIGSMGHTGYTIPAGSAGCHLHFEVWGARNPFAR